MFTPRHSAQVQVFISKYLEELNDFIKRHFEIFFGNFISQCDLLEDFLQKLAEEMEKHPIWSGTSCCCFFYSI